MRFIEGGDVLGTPPAAITPDISSMELTTPNCSDDDGTGIHQENEDLDSAPLYQPVILENKNSKFPHFWYNFS